MSLSAEQKHAVAAWVAAGDNLSAVQKKLREQFQVSLTYMEVRFLIDDLNLALKDAAPKASADLSAPSPRPDAPSGRQPAPAPDDQEPDADAYPENGYEDIPEEAVAADATLDDANTPAGGNVSVSVDKVTLIPGAVASGTVTFSDGVTGKWIVDHYGRPGFTEISQPGYRPTPTDGQAFMQQLSQALAKQGY
ncbi:MAG: hypothetical protein SFV32_08875 [Opitutaceae bacterium]|nr:hypothetical protein [Opitutaceae bacterium]